MSRINRNDAFKQPVTGPASRVYYTMDARHNATMESHSQELQTIMADCAVATTAYQQVTALEHMLLSVDNTPANARIMHMVLETYLGTRTVTMESSHTSMEAVDVKAVLIKAWEKIKAAFMKVYTTIRKFFTDLGSRCDKLIERVGNIMRGKKAATEDGDAGHSGLPAALCDGQGHPFTPSTMKTFAHDMVFVLQQISPDSLLRMHPTVENIKECYTQLYSTVGTGKMPAGAQNGNYKLPERGHIEFRARPTHWPKIEESVPGSTFKADSNYGPVLVGRGDAVEPTGQEMDLGASALHGYGEALIEILKFTKAHMQAVHELSETSYKFSREFDGWYTNADKAPVAAPTVRIHSRTGEVVSSTPAPAKTWHHFTDYGSADKSASDYDPRGTFKLCQVYTTAISQRTMIATIAVHHVYGWANKAVAALEHITRTQAAA